MNSNINITGRVLKTRYIDDLDEKTHTLVTLLTRGSLEQEVLFSFKVPGIYDGHKIIIEYNRNTRYMKIYDVDFNKFLYDGKIVKNKIVLEEK